MIMEYIQANWIKWVFALLIAVLAWCHKQVMKQLAAEKTKNDAIGEGVQALLRDSIVVAYNKYHGKGYCPIYAKESVKKAYKAYHELGGNDVAEELYRRILAMPEEGENEHE